MTNTSIYKTLAGEHAIMDIYDSILARWPVPYTGITLPTRHGDTFIIASGDETAPPLVLLHGSASNATAWIGDIEALSRHFRVYAVDTIGEPGRSVHNRPPWDGPAYADWLKDMLDGLQLEQAAVMGISQGGWTALKFASTYPHCVSKLLLLAPGGVMQPKASFFLRAIPLSLFGRWGAERTNRIVFGKEPISMEAKEIMNTIMTHFIARKDFQPLFTDEQLSCLTMPVLVIGGVEDALFPIPKMAERLDALLPHLTSLMLPGIGHVLMNLTEKTIPFLLDG